MAIFHGPEQGGALFWSVKMFLGDLRFLMGKPETPPEEKIEDPQRQQSRITTDLGGGGRRR